MLVLQEAMVEMGKNHELCRTSVWHRHAILSTHISHVSVEFILTLATRNRQEKKKKREPKKQASDRVFYDFLLVLGKSIKTKTEEEAAHFWCPNDSD